MPRLISQPRRSRGRNSWLAAVLTLSILMVSGIVASPASADRPDTTTYSPSAASSTSILAAPARAVTNQVITLVATVTSSVRGPSPTGTVAFANRGARIPGCGAVRANGRGQSVTVTCMARFVAARSPEQLTAAFNPAPGSPVAGSRSTSKSLTIRRDSTTSSVKVSNPVVTLGRAVSYTASVQGSHTGPAKPAGTVEFFDHGRPITACLKQSLATATVGAQAHCVLRYASTGSHAITIAYGGDANFVGSGSSSAMRVTVTQTSLGTIASTMQWGFRFTRSFTRIVTLLIDSVSPGTSVAVLCHGRGCPFARRSTTVKASPRCRAKGKAACPPPVPRTIDLESEFRGRALHGGARVTILLTRPHWVGKYFQFAMRAAGAPRIRIACLAPGSTTPGVGC